VADAWIAALDGFEASLADGETGLGVLLAQLGDAPVGILVDSWSPPSDIGPVPPELIGRARVLHARSVVLEGQLEFVRDQTMARLAELRGRRSPSRGGFDAGDLGASSIDHLA
jgi:hypothetical protein